MIQRASLCWTWPVNNKKAQSCFLDRSSSLISTREAPIVMKCGRLIHRKSRYRKIIRYRLIHEPTVLLRRQGFGFCFRPWPLETAGLQTLVQKDKTIAFPVERLDTIPASAAEQEQGIAEWVQVKGLLHHGRKTIYSSPQICVAAGNVDLVGAGKIAQHDFIIWSTILTVSESAPLWMSASAPAIRTVTAISVEGGTNGVTSAKLACCWALAISNSFFCHL